jgi:glycosyltransferase involved in cell wall biosynthesis
VQRLAQTLGLSERVRFRGFQTQAALREIVARAHLHLVSSRHEAGPVALLEAALAGVPTVGTCVGHLAEWQPTAAWTVPVGDARALAAGILALYHDDSRRLALARAAQQRALNEDAAFTARELERVFASLCGGSVRQTRVPSGEPARDAGTVLAEGRDDVLPPARHGQETRDTSPDSGRLPAP